MVLLAGGPTLYKTAFCSTLPNWFQKNQPGAVSGKSHAGGIVIYTLQLPSEVREAITPKRPAEVNLFRYGFRWSFLFCFLANSQTFAKGNVLAQDLQETDILTPHPLWAEQWPDVWLKAAKTSIKNAVAKSGVKPEDVKAIAISGLYGGSGIPLDMGGEPVRPRMIWMDRRAQMVNF